MDKFKPIDTTIDTEVAATIRLRGETGWATIYKLAHALEDAYSHITRLEAKLKLAEEERDEALRVVRDTSNE